MNKFFLIVSFTLILTNSVLSQRKTPELDTQKNDEEVEANKTFGTNDSWKDKMIYGGNIGGSLGNISSFFMIQPIIGYRISEKFQAGISPLYIYSSRTFQLTSGKTLTQSISAYGPGVYGRYFINPNIFAHTEYLGLSYKIYNEISGVDVSRYSNSMFVGGGYIPGESGVYIVALYDLLYNSNNSFYNNPIDIRIGFVF